MLDGSTRGPIDTRSTVLDGHTISTYSEFFRPGTLNSAVLAKEIAPWYAATHGIDLLKLADVACSTAKNTYCTAAALAIYGVKAHITAYDVNADVLQQAREPYELTMKELENLLGKSEWGLPKECLDFFEAVGSEHIQPTAELQRMVTLRESTDLRRQPLPDKYDMITANNFLYHYNQYPGDQRAIMHNIVAGLKVGGIFTLNTPFIVGPHLYRENGLRPVGKLEVPYSMPSSIPPFFMKEPETATPQENPAEVWRAFYV